MKAIEILNRCRAADAEISRIRQRIEQRNSALYRITASPMDANGGSRASGNHDKIGTLEADIDTLQRQMLARKRAKQVEIAAACALLDYLDAATFSTAFMCWAKPPQPSPPRVGIKPGRCGQKRPKR